MLSVPCRGHTNPLLSSILKENSINSNQIKKTYTKVITNRHNDKDERHIRSRKQIIHPYFP